MVKARFMPVGPFKPLIPAQVGHGHDRYKIEDNDKPMVMEYKVLYRQATRSRRTNWEGDGTLRVCFTGQAVLRYMDTAEELGRGKIRKSASAEARQYSLRGRHVTVNGSWLKPRHSGWLTLTLTLILLITLRLQCLMTGLVCLGHHNLAYLTEISTWQEGAVNSVTVFCKLLSSKVKMLWLLKH